MDDPRIPVTFDQSAPLARLKGESARAWQALQDYYNLGAGRSESALINTYRIRIASEPDIRPPSLRKATVSVWGSSWSWQARIARQDELKRQEEERARQAALAESARVWAERRQSVREEDWKIAEQLRKLAGKILEETPRFIKTTRRLQPGKNGEPDREIITLALNGEMAIRAAETASKMQRLAAEMELDHVTIEEAEPGVSLEELRQARWLQAARALQDPSLAGEEGEPAGLPAPAPALPEPTESGG